MRKLTDWPFRDRPEVNGAVFMLALIAGALLMVWIVTSMAVLNADVH